MDDGDGQHSADEAEYERGPNCTDGADNICGVEDVDVPNKADIENMEDVTEDSDGASVINSYDGEEVVDDADAVGGFMKGNGVEIVFCVDKA